MYVCAYVCKLAHYRTFSIFCDAILSNIYSTNLKNVTRMYQKSKAVKIENCIQFELFVFL